ncbi:CRISPR-associated endonuclease Cas2 [Cellvibrio japonicus]|uniref:CRISPR-associated endoribonuclease Cas2 n=1 Tax=Cellvibrio japonicus (strain Ueda107) TaxID=498211 RepID=B3PKI3_CELJU|nr:CRISPR-associated endonuclease Cas2 [Cellvibrio japonicus]ACE82893.1 CRISPR-associated protein Cas2 [Cellvibrio japonicus Ueda107]QEI12847.1 CRISPR-associated endonuclease Cas2 [Cellvibrio japonicus]QEI16421.1 CRISPR-associated endonuclease Cas2 [Cellvibrio japonicus]QEI19999.1 CRISPR-associated endonuclease Cas2 [Cellvibrio japonicus]
MLVLITYDVSVTSPGGSRRLRNIAKTCLDYGVRVQNSVFECEVDPAQFVNLKNSLVETFDPNEDSLRFYFLGKKGHQKIEHIGTKFVQDPLRTPLIL